MKNIIVRWLDENFVFVRF